MKKGMSFAPAHGAHSDPAIDGYRIHARNNLTDETIATQRDRYLGYDACALDHRHVSGTPGGL